MTIITISDAAHAALNELRDERRPANRYNPDALRELRQNNLIRDVSGGWLTISKAGLDYLLPEPPAAPKPAEPPPPRSGTPSKARSLPVTSPPPTKQRPDLLTDPVLILRALEAVGGSAPVDQLGAHGSTLRKMARVGQIVYDGITASIQSGAPAPTAALEPAAEPVIPSNEGQPQPDDHSCVDDCATCFNKRALDYLMHSSGKVRAIVERFAEQERASQQLDDAVQQLFN